jgi:hypothetical protein
MIVVPNVHYLRLCDHLGAAMSPLTRYLSRLLGLFLLITAVADLTQPVLLSTIAPAMLDRSALLFVSGLLTLAPGLAIIIGHNVWNGAAAVIVTLLGWLMTIKGAALLLVLDANWTAILSALRYPSYSSVHTVILVVGGAHLTYAGFFRSKPMRPQRRAWRSAWLRKRDDI